MSKKKKAKVILFRRSGKYYTQEKWRIPDTEEAKFGPHCMEESPDFRRIDGGHVYVPTQEPWGFPCIIPAKVEIGWHSND